MPMELKYMVSPRGMKIISLEHPMIPLLESPAIKKRQEMGDGNE